MKRAFLGFCLIISSLFSLCNGQAVLAADPIQWRPIELGPDSSNLFGIWRNASLGHIALFSDEGVRVFHHLDGYCLADTGVVPEFKLYHLEQGSDQLYLHYYDYREMPWLLQNPLVYKRLNKLPEACEGQSEVDSAELIEIFDLVWTLFDRYYAFFEEQDVNWQELRAVYRPRASTLTNDQALFELLSEMLGHLNDGHVNLTWKENTFNAGRPMLRQRLTEAWHRADSKLPEQAFVSRWSQDVRSSVRNLIDAGSYHEGADGALEWGLINGSVGYIRINRFRAFDRAAPSRQAELATLERTLADMKRDLRNADRLIVDVVHNGGGHDAAAMTIVRHFLDEPRDVIEYAAMGSPTVRVSLQPAGAGEKRETILLTSEITASAAESFVLMMKDLPHVTQAGGRTRGGISSLLPKPLPRGFRVTISYQTVRDANGRLFEARGIPPEREIELFPETNLFGNYAQSIRMLAEEDLAD